MKTINENELGLALIFRNRSGYEGCTFMVEDREDNTISEKSNEYEKRRAEAKRLPIVSMENGYISEITDHENGTFDVEYGFHSRITKRTVNSVIRAYQMNGLKAVSVSADENCVIIRGTQFNK